MGLFKKIIGKKYLEDMIENKDKKKNFQQIKEESAVDIFESTDIYFLRMEEKAGAFGKRVFVITNPSGDVVYTAKKTGTYKFPHFTLFTAKDNEVGSVKTVWSLYKPIFNIEMSNRDYELKQTTATRSLYELEEYGWQIQAKLGKTIICDEKWTKIIQIEWENTTLKGGKQTDIYKVKMRNRKHQKVAVLLALAMYISHRYEYQ